MSVARAPRSRVQQAASSMLLDALWRGKGMAGAARARVWREVRFSRICSHPQHVAKRVVLALDDERRGVRYARVRRDRHPARARERASTRERVSSPLQRLRARAHLLFIFPVACRVRRLACGAAHFCTLSSSGSRQQSKSSGLFMAPTLERARRRHAERGAGHAKAHRRPLRLDHRHQDRAE